LLVLHGHSSRFILEAIHFLENKGIDVFFLPAHCTPILRPFNGAIASPLKIYLARFFQESELTITEDATFELANSFVSPLCWRRNSGSCFTLFEGRGTLLQRFAALRQRSEKSESYRWIPRRTGRLREQEQADLMNFSLIPLIRRRS
jgi:hypothetical protein